MARNRDDDALRPDEVSPEGAPIDDDPSLERPDPLGLGGTTPPDAPSRRPRPRIVALLGEFFRMSRTTAILLISFVLAGVLYLLVREEPVVAFGPPPPPTPTAPSEQDDPATTPTEQLTATTAPTPTTPPNPTGTGTATTEAPAPGGAATTTPRPDGQQGDADQQSPQQQPTPQQQPDQQSQQQQQAPGAGEAADPGGAPLEG